MTSPSTENTAGLLIQENTNFTLENFEVEVLSYLSQTADVYYFKVNIRPSDDNTAAAKLGLMRVGSVEGALSRELQLRQALGDYKLIAELIARSEKESVTINLPSPQLSNSFQLRSDADITGEISVESADNSGNIQIELEFLEEEHYPTEARKLESSDRRLILLSYLPEPEQTLETWLTQEQTLETSLLLTSQICQLFRYTNERGWCFVDLLPQLIQVGTPIKFFDLTGAYPSGKALSSGLLGEYCAPELSGGNHSINELMSSYTIGALLYQSIHKQPPQSQHQINPEIKQIPRIYQLLTICLSPIPEDRFGLSQLLKLLVETRQSFSSSKIQWNVASRSTIGLSTSRLQNEDSYGVRQLQLSNSNTLILAVVADGMGGMNQGELASKLAVKTVLEEPIPAELTTSEKQAEWLVDLVQKANDSVSSQVKDGGTTLSLVLAIARNLTIAHVGDSRIYLLRKGEIRQLSQDHSLVAMLVANGQITPEESEEHPDRNILTKSLGSKRKLSDGYVQDLSCWGEGLSLTLEDKDILLLCSDGVWDLVRKEQLAETFKEFQSLQSNVDQIIALVLEKGAPDNATLLALECRVDRSY